jgi:hypothetical protein
MRPGTLTLTSPTALAGFQTAVPQNSPAALVLSSSPAPSLSPNLPLGGLVTMGGQMPALMPMHFPQSLQLMAPYHHMGIGMPGLGFGMPMFLSHMAGPPAIPPLFQHQLSYQPQLAPAPPPQQFRSPGSS